MVHLLLLLLLLFVWSLDQALDETPNGVYGGGSPDEDHSMIVRRRLASISDMSPVLKLIKEGIQSKVGCSGHVMVV